MKKHEFKRILQILDVIELQNIPINQVAIETYEKLIEDNHNIRLTDVKEIINYIFDHHLVTIGRNGFDLNPAPTIFAKSNPCSEIELISLYESLIHNQAIQSFIKADGSYEYFNLLDSNTRSLLTQTSLSLNGTQALTSHLATILQTILAEYETKKPLLSTYLMALYTSSIVSHSNMRIEYKNEHSEINDYDDLDTILSILPRRGIPHDRDETKALQSFYKDCLFNEFDHCCPICGAHLPYMLIASHIKPFRDCGHLFECIDYHNGLLLCRNHDYLFDQGYFTILENGKIKVSSLIDESEYELYQLNDRKLADKYLSKDRLSFLNYHHNHIYQK